MTPTISPIPEHLPGEPPIRVWTTPQIAGELTRKSVQLCVMALLTLALWPFYLLLRLGMERPPNSPSLQRYLRCLRAIMTEQPEGFELKRVERWALALSLFRRWAATPLWGLAWYLDELLYGRALRRTTLVKPLFEISAARSGSTQLAHYLEDDPHLCAPSLLQSVFPYVWLWKIAPYTFGRFFTTEQIHEKILGLMPHAYLQRHEMDPFRTDTFEILFLYGTQLGGLMLSLGPRILLEEFSPGKLTEPTRELWEGDFLRFIDAIGRKTVYYATRDPNAPPRRLMIKGHFLAVAPHLAERYPDARFLTVLRSPDKRVQSIINFFRCQPTEDLCGPVPWSSILRLALTVEPEYCDAELDWYQRSDGVHRCVVRFDDYVRDLEGTMRRVYHECLEIEELPPHVPRTHAPRVRTHYSIDRTLAQLQVDVGWLQQRLSGYYQWCRGDKAA